MPQITVILPAYNVAPYIKECLVSVCSQTLRNIEILIVDAGSTDGTVEMIQRFQQGDGRIRLIHSDRKSYGYQMNLGLRSAAGDYIAIVETDDFIISDMLECLWAVAKETGADYVKGNLWEVIELQEGIYWKDQINSLDFNRELYNQILKPSDYPELIRHDIYHWRGLYRKKFLEQNEIFFHETPGAAFQDAGFLFQTITLAEKAYYIEKPVYFYRKGNEGASIMNPQGYRFLVEEYEYIFQLMSEKNEEGFEKILPYFYGRLFDQCAGRTRTMASQGRIWKGIDKAVQRIRDILMEGYQSGKFHAGIMKPQLWKEVMMFLDDPNQYITYQMCIYKGKKKILEDMVQYLEKYEKIIICSCGKTAQFAYTLLVKQKLSVEAFCDNDKQKWETVCLDKNVLSVENAIKGCTNAVYVIANIRYSESICEQLVSEGIMRENIIIWGLEKDLLLLSMKC